jgi:hypothetical protein
VTDWNSPMTPTPSLAEYAELEKADRNFWWRLSCGHHQNLFEMAVDRIEVLEGKLASLEAFVKEEAPWLDLSDPRVERANDSQL